MEYGSSSFTDYMECDDVKSELLPQDGFDFIASELLPRDGFEFIRQSPREKEIAYHGCYRGWVPKYGMLLGDKTVKDLPFKIVEGWQGMDVHPEYLPTYYERFMEIANTAIEFYNGKHQTAHVVDKVEEASMIVTWPTPYRISFTTTDGLAFKTEVSSEGLGRPKKVRSVECQL